MGKRFRFKGKLFSLDGSLIDLSMKIFPWADVAPKKPPFKLHLGLDHDGLIPAFAEVTEGLASEMDAADTFNFPKGSVLVFDRGYSRYTSHKQLTDKGLFWVTRARKGMRYEVIRAAPVPEGGAVISDQIIQLTSRQARQAGVYDIRRIEYRDPENNKRYVFITNQKTWSAQTVLRLAQLNAFVRKPLADCYAREHERRPMPRSYARWGSRKWGSSGLEWEVSCEWAYM